MPTPKFISVWELHGYGSTIRVHVGHGSARWPDQEKIFPVSRFLSHRCLCASCWDANAPLSGHSSTHPPVPRADLNSAGASPHTHRPSPPAVRGPGSLRCSDRAPPQIPWENIPTIGDAWGGAPGGAGVSRRVRVASYTGSAIRAWLGATGSAHPPQAQCALGTVARRRASKPNLKGTERAKRQLNP